jgi:hypothetical protein
MDILYFNHKGGECLKILKQILNNKNQKKLK